VAWHLDCQLERHLRTLTWFPVQLNNLAWDQGFVSVQWGGVVVRTHLMFSSSHRSGYSLYRLARQWRRLGRESAPCFWVCDVLVSTSFDLASSAGISWVLYHRKVNFLWQSCNAVWAFVHSVVHPHAFHQAGTESHGCKQLLCNPAISDCR